MDATDALGPLKKVTAVTTDCAAEAIAKLTGQQVTTTVSTVRLVAIEEVLAEIGDITSVTSVVVVKIGGDMHGLLFLALNPGDARSITKDTIKQTLTQTYIDQDLNVLCEMTNIIAGAMLNSLSQLLDLRLEQSPPAGTTDILGAALDPFLAEFGTKFDKVLVQKEVFSIPAQGSSLKLLAIIDPPSTDRILQKIKADSQNATNY